MKTERHKLVRRLSTQHASNVKLYNGFISLTFDNRRIRNKVVKKHERSIAEWSRGKKEVFYDEHVKKEDILPLLVHETIEKYVTEKYGLDVDTESHKIAQAAERRFIKRSKHEEWATHEKRIERLWERENNGKKL